MFSLSHTYLGTSALVPKITFYNFVTVVRGKGICLFTYMHPDMKHAGDALGHVPDHWLSDFVAQKARDC